MKTMIYRDLFKDIARSFDRHRPITILEIGVGKHALSTRAFLLGLSLRKEASGILYSIDFNQHNTIKDLSIKPRLYAKEIGMEKNWIFIEEDSTKVDWDKKINILFIDGDHSYLGVKTDFEKYVPFVKKGGIILMHDIRIGSYGVKDYWKEIKYPKASLILDRCGLGIVNKI